MSDQTLLHDTPTGTSEPQQKINLRLPFRTANELAVLCPAQDVEWIAPGLVALGHVTEITGAPKLGKTTFLTHMAKAILAGSDFLGQTTQQSAVLYCTEQSKESFRGTLAATGVVGLCGDRMTVLNWSDTHGLRWADVARCVIEECRRVGAVVWVVDTLPQFAGLRGDAENNAGDALEAMQPLQEAAAAGLAVISCRHERKSGGNVTESGRGSNAFTGAADITISIGLAEGQANPNFRVLRGIGRPRGTLEKMTIELTPDGYVTRDGGSVRASLLQTSPIEPPGLTCAELAELNGYGETVIRAMAAQLSREGLLTKTGTGHRGSAVRYYKNSAVAEVAS